MRRERRQRRFGFEKNIQDLETIQQDFFNKIEYARAELHKIIKILLKGSITKREQESPKRVLDETLGMPDNTKKNRVSFSPKSKSSSLAQQSTPPRFVNKMIADLKKTDRDMSIEGRIVFKKHWGNFQEKHAEIGAHFTRQSRSSN